MDWLYRVAESVALEGPTVRVVIVETSGPTPRAVGTAMLVTTGGQKGRIGRGDVERRAVEEARRMIAEAEAGASLEPVWRRHVMEFESGHVLSERSFGAIVLLLEVFAAPEVEELRRARSGLRGDLLLSRPMTDGGPAELLGDDGSRVPAVLKAWRAGLRAAPGASILRIRSGGLGVDTLVERIAPRLERFNVYGTGLVARALVRLLADLPFETVWLDSTPSHFPPTVPERVEARDCFDLAAAAHEAPPRGFHAVMTASHDLDLAVCRSLARAGTFAYVGVIGSRLKRQRLMERLAADGCAGDVLARIVCPIGLPQIRSKRPEVIAVAIAAQALMVAQDGPALDGVE